MTTMETAVKTEPAAPPVAPEKVDKTKTGVSTGGYVRNPATGETIPVWIADYVLMGYGTGAIMAVPGHDQRDFEFAKQFELPIVRVVAAPGEGADSALQEAYDGPGTLVNSGPFDGLDSREGARRITAWAAENDKLGLPILAYSVAAAAGRVLVGQIGTPRQRSFDVLGAPANVAVKLTSVATMRDVDNLVTGETVAPGTAGVVEVEGIELGGHRYRLFRVE